MLLAGMRAFNRGDKVRSQLLMRYRVLFQGATIGFMMVSVIASQTRRRSNELKNAPEAAAPPSTGLPSSQ